MNKRNRIALWMSVFIMGYILGVSLQRFVGDDSAVIGLIVLGFTMILIKE